MVDMYFTLITQTDNWTLSRVPYKYQEEVENRLITNGYDENGSKAEV